MAFDRFLIAPFTEDSGLTTNAKAWQIPDNAFSQMDNAYVFRGRVQKRFGSRYMGSGSSVTVTDPLKSRLRIAIGTTDANGEFAFGGTFPTGVLVEDGCSFSAGGVVFYVPTVPLVVGNETTLSTATGTSTGTLRLNSTGPNVYQFRIVGVNLAIATQTIYFYPAQPVMGLGQYDFSEINNFRTLGFDTQYAYQWTNANGWTLSSGSPLWHGTDTNFFWTCNARYINAGLTAMTNALFTTNFYVVNKNGAGSANDDPLYYYDGTTWTAYVPYLNPNGGAVGTGPFVKTALMIVQFKGRLVLLNTVENDGSAAPGVNTHFPQRARYSADEDVFSASAWYTLGAFDVVPNIGTTAGFKDAPTAEQIVSCTFIKDRLIVFFEESTWELAYTGNEQDPFTWQKINTELGSMGTFGTIPFDKASLTIGETGVNSCNGQNVQRIDQKIPQEIFKVANKPVQTKRICGIRDYYNEVVYWAYPEADQLSTQPYPTRVLMYNYENKTWAQVDDCITAFGYFDNQQRITWADLSGTWEEWKGPWNAGLVGENTRQILAGNQQGFTFIIDTDGYQSSRNAGVLQVTEMSLVPEGIQMTIYDHMLKDGDYIYIENASGVVLEGFKIYEVVVSSKDIIIATYPEEIVNTYGFYPTYEDLGAGYQGGATAARVSNYRIKSKQWNPYDKDGRNVYISKIDFYIERSDYGEVAIVYSPSSSELNMVTEGNATSALVGTGVLDMKPYPIEYAPLEQFQDRLWHPVYLQVDGQCVQIYITMTPLQICTPTIAFSDFELHGLVLHTMATTSRFQ